MPALAQIVLWQNPETGEISCEVPQGGGRRKINLPKEKSQWGEVLSRELQSFSQWITFQEREKEKIRDEELLKRAEKKAKAEIERRHRIWDATARNHHRGSTSGIELANRVIGPRNVNSKPIMPSMIDLLNAERL